MTGWNEFKGMFTLVVGQRSRAVYKCNGEKWKMKHPSDVALLGFEARYGVHVIGLARERSWFNRRNYHTKLSKIISHIFACFSVVTADFVPICWYVMIYLLILNESPSGSGFDQSDNSRPKISMTHFSPIFYCTPLLVAFHWHSQEI